MEGNAGHRLVSARSAVALGTLTFALNVSALLLGAGLGGRVMFVVGDVTDKGIPAALVMASTHALLRDAAPRLISPGQVLGHVNEMLCVDIPAHMFVTCLALVLDPVSGRVEFANADLCLTELSDFTGPEHEQEDDITLVSLQRSPSAWHQGGGGL